MSKIKKFRIDGNKIPEFYIKLQDNNNRVLSSIGIDNDGIFYYRPKSSILTDAENQGTRESYDGFISMEEIKELFEAMIKAGLDYEPERGKRLDISHKRNSVYIEKGKREK